MAKPSFELVGFKECIDGLNEFSRTVAGNVVKRALVPAAAVVGKAAQDRAPVSPRARQWKSEPGSLKASLEIKPGKGSKTPTVAVLFNDDAAVPTEYGLTSRDYPPQPWFRPAVDATETAALRAFGAALKPGVEQAAAKAARRSAKAKT
jgi:hypothetical protein